MSPDYRFRAAKVLSLALGQPLDPFSNPRREKIPQWDSLKHVELILMLEEEFQIRISSAEAPGLSSLEEIILKVAKKNAP
jgi:acyl carrier protein